MGRGPAALTLFVGPGNVTVKQPCVCIIKALSPLLVTVHSTDFGRVSSKSGTSSNHLLLHSRDLPCQYFLIGLDRPPSPSTVVSVPQAQGSGHVLPLLQVETAFISASSTFDFRCLSFSLFLSTPCPPLAPPPGSHHTAIPVAGFDPLPRVAVGSAVSDRTRSRTRARGHPRAHHGAQSQSAIGCGLEASACHRRRPHPLMDRHSISRRRVGRRLLRPFPPRRPRGILGKDACRVSVQSVAHGNGTWRPHTRERG